MEAVRVPTFERFLAQHFQQLHRDHFMPGIAIVKTIHYKLSVFGPSLAFLGIPPSYSDT